MVVNSSGQMEADLSDYQKDLLYTSIQDTIDGQIGFKNVQRTDRAGTKAAGAAKNDIVI